MILIAEDSKGKFQVVCDEHGVIGNGQTGQQYALDRAMEHVNVGVHRQQGSPGCLRAPEVRLIVHRSKTVGHPNRWLAYAPVLVWRWREAPEAERSTRPLLEKALRG